MGFRDYLGAIDSYLGDDDMLGAPARRHAIARHGHPGMHPLRGRVLQTLSQPMPGVPAQGPREEPLGFTTVTFTNASGTTLQATAQPQKPFKGKRLVIVPARSRPSRWACARC
jgi:hypothetical protein